MNRRGFIASLIALPCALRAVLEAPRLPEPAFIRPSDYDLVNNRRLWVIDWSDIRAVPEMRHRFETKLARQLAMPAPRLP